MSEHSKIDELLTIRKALGFSQNQMAQVIDLSLREYQSFEWGEQEIPDLYLRALERIAMQYAIQAEDPRLIPQSLREEAVKLARIVTARA